MRKTMLVPVGEATEEVTMIGKLTITEGENSVTLAVHRPVKRSPNRKFVLAHWQTGLMLDGQRVEGKCWDVRAAELAWESLCARRGKQRVWDVVARAVNYPALNGGEA